MLAGLNTFGAGLTVSVSAGTGGRLTATVSAGAAGRLTVSDSTGAVGRLTDTDSAGAGGKGTLNRGATASQAIATAIPAHATSATTRRLRLRGLTQTPTGSLASRGSTIA